MIYESRFTNYMTRIVETRCAVPWSSQRQNPTMPRLPLARTGGSTVICSPFHIYGRIGWGGGGSWSQLENDCDVDGWIIEFACMHVYEIILLRHDTHKMLLYSTYFCFLKKLKIKLQEGRRDIFCKRERDENTCGLIVRIWIYMCM